MKKAMIAERAQFPWSSPGGAGRVCARIHRVLLEEGGRAPADVTGTGRGLTGGT